MTIMQLKYFLAVCEQKSMAKASEKMNVSQPALSLSIKDLERDLNVQLFIRDGRKIQLTSEGITLRTMALELINKSDNITSYFKNISENQKEIHIGMSCIFDSILGPVIEKYTKKNCNTDIITYTFGRYDFHEFLNNNKIDFVILGSSVLDDLSMFNVEPIGSLDVVLYANINNPLSMKDAISFPDIANEPFIIFTEQNDLSEFRQSMERFMPSLSLKNIVSYTSQLSVVSDMIANEKGVAIIAKNAIRNNDRIITVPIKDGASVDVVVVWDKQRSLNSECIKIIQSFKNALSAM